MANRTRTSSSGNNGTNNIRAADASGDGTSSAGDAGATSSGDNARDASGTSSAGSSDGTTDGTGPGETSGDNARDASSAGGIADDGVVFDKAVVLAQLTRFSNGRAVGRAFGALVLGAALFIFVMRLAVRAALPSWSVAVLVPASFLAMVVLAFRTGVAIGAVDDTSRPLLRRHGFWVVAIATVIGLPALGACGLIDPWETHYAEVAREMLERRDFVSPWWAHEGWFMSKPVLTFWLEAIAMAVFGVRTGPDQILAGATSAAHAAHAAHPEWAVRFPGFALALIGSYILYDGVARTCGKRAGLLGAVALWTMPGFALLSHQAMTDMPLVACVAASLGLLLRALSTTDAVLVTRYVVRLGRRREIELHAGHAIALMIALVTLSQVLMLFLQHVHIDSSSFFGVHIRPDRLLAGSPHACTLPGQPACASTPPAHPRITPSLQSILWLPSSLWLITRAWSEKRVARLLSLTAWTFAALAAMAKGPAGLAIPAAAVIAHALARRSIRAALRLEVIPGIVLAITMIGPWYLAVFARHGRGFIDELVMRHMLGRTLDHLHDTNEGEDVGVVYFIRQLGYATFPWSGIALGAMLAAARSSGSGSGDEKSRRGSTRAFLFGAAMIAFALVSSMRTKFHHYVLIALPPIAMLGGMWMDELIAIAEARRKATTTKNTSWRGGARSLFSGGAVIAAACVVALVARDLATTSDGIRGPARFILLLSYRYNRVWSSTTAFGTALAVLGVLVTIVTLASASGLLRRRAIMASGALAIVFAIVLLDVYLPRCASDGGQRDVIAAYYKDRAASAQSSSPLVAYQLNWKGENFYTGNHVAIFVSSGAPMKTYLDKRRERDDQRTVYFVTERGRVTGLQHELGAVRSFVELTGPNISTEFTLVRAQLL